MLKIASLFLVSLLVAASALAHGGHSHTILGTVKVVNDGHLLVTTKDGKEVTVHLTAGTKYTKADRRAKRSDLVPGSRVSIQLAKDSKSAETVKIGSPKSK
jgi:predicted MarR family transcription regulator